MSLVKVFKLHDQFTALGSLLFGMNTVTMWTPLLFNLAAFSRALSLSCAPPSATINYIGRTIIIFNKSVIWCSLDRHWLLFVLLKNSYGMFFIDFYTWQRPCWKAGTIAECFCVDAQYKRLRKRSTLTYNITKKNTATTLHTYARQIYQMGIYQKLPVNIFSLCCHQYKWFNHRSYFY